MLKRSIAAILALGATFVVWAIPIAGQEAKPKNPAIASNQIEPLRVISGEMRGPLISGTIHVNGKPVAFSFVFEKAAIVNGQLQLSGTFSLGSSGRYRVSAKPAGAMARVANPWPSASDIPPRRNIERESKKPTQDASEQTQSLYAQTERVSGCGVLFFSLTLPTQLKIAMGAGEQAVQLGVVLEQFDNRLGEEINKSICQLFEALKLKSYGEEVSNRCDHLNSLLASSK
jgi:hypothetical protein